MLRPLPPILAIFSAVVGLGLGGCTSLTDYVHNGFKVGPNYTPACAAVGHHWIDADDVRVRSLHDDLSKWWMVFNDPRLDSLIGYAYRQNLSLRVAACRVLEARAQVAIDTGNLFPQTQTATGSYTHNALSETLGNSSFAEQRWTNQWNAGFNLSWELDLWGRLRRAIESDADNLDASVENYDDVLVTLLGDVATNYVTYRTTQRRIEYAQANVALQRKTLAIVIGSNGPALWRILTWSRPAARWKRPRRPFRNWKSPCGRPPTNFASCWEFLPRTCKPGWERA